jgi:diguanylate cyclase (GGDEF)-like protein
MKSHVLFKPYIYTISVVGISIAVWQLATVPLNMSLQLLMLLLFCTAAECYHYYYEERHTSLSLGAASSFFLMMFFPFSAVVLFCILSIFVQAFKRKKMGLMERLINKKTVFNVAAYVIFNYVTYLGIKWLDISIPRDALLMGALVIFQNVLNGVLVCMAQSLAANKSNFDTLFKDMSAFYLYLLIFSLMLVYNYNYIGIWAVVGLYSIFIAVQNSTQLKIDIKIKDEKINRDNLTGVYNREFFIKTVEAKLKSKKQFSIIFLDLDNFKSVNDIHGHLVGDMALQELVSNIKGILKDKDLLYRYGGDEFVIVLPDRKEAEAVGSRLYSNEIAIQYGKEPISIKFSTGIYNCTGRETSYADIIRRVDAAMYESKQKGGNQIVYVDENEGAGNTISI